MSIPRNEADAAGRRIRVFDLFRVGLSQEEISKRVGVSQAQVCRDLKRLRLEFKEKYGAEFDPDAIVHEELENLEWIKQRALREYQRMLPVTDQTGKVVAARDSPSEVRARLKALDTAKHASIDRIMLMQDLGMVERNLGSLDLTGSEVAKALREIETAAAGAAPEDNLSDGERAWLHPAPTREM